MNLSQVNKQEFQHCMLLKQSLEMANDAKRKAKRFDVVRGEQNDWVRCMVCGKMVPVRENQIQVTCQCGNFIKLTPGIMKKLNDNRAKKVECKKCLDKGLIFYRYQRGARLYSGVGRCNCKKGRHLQGYEFLPIVDQSGHVLEQGNNECN